MKMWALVLLAMALGIAGCATTPSTAGAPPAPVTKAPVIQGTTAGAAGVAVAITAVGAMLHPESLAEPTPAREYPPDP